MIETTIPEIDIAELMERVRAEALRPKPPPRRVLPPAESALLPPVAMLPATPAVWIPGTVKSRKDRLDVLVQSAREKNEPSSKIPKFLRRFFRKQGGYNRAVLESVAALSKTSDDLARRVGEITTCLDQLNNWLLALHEQSDADANWMKAAAPAVTRASAQEGQLGHLRDELQAALVANHSNREELDRSIRSLEQQRDELAGKIGETETRFQDQIAALKQQAEATAALAGELRGRVESIGEDLSQTRAETGSGQAVRSDLAQLGVHINNLQGFVDKQVAETSAIQHSLEQRVGEMADDAAFVKGELSEYGLLLRGLLAKDFKAPALSKKSGAANGFTPGLDSFYFNFENRFRGPRDEIKARTAFYLPFVRKAGAGALRSPVLDLGCGRGEWLELLKEHKLEGRGVDLNTVMVAQCKARGLKVRLGDAVEHLHSLRANSHGAITGFHIIEHVPFEILMALFGEVRRVLKPGGVAIFESPNCKNLMVGACNFNIDPTHRNPVFPDTAEFMLASHGFEKIRIEYLSPVTDSKFEGSTPELARIKDFLYGPQDFGIIAYKPKKR